MVELVVTIASVLSLAFHKELEQILQSISDAGGKPLFVGGFVRDFLLGELSKDVDIEVYGLGVSDLVHVLEPFGWVEQVGASFGVIKLVSQEAEYDFALPRRENKQGQGYRGFMVQADPSMDPKEAASRRDYTINAMALTSEGDLLDFFGGQADLKNKRLRHVSSKFSEDPLRVLRGFQLAARFDFQMDKETALLCRQLKAEYAHLSKERIWTEWQKWACKSIKPSRGLEVLKETGWLELYPELTTLIGVQQEFEWHPEGDVWQHTNYVLDEAVRIVKREGLKDEQRLIVVLAALCHDLGKAVTTFSKEGRWVSPGHAEAGVMLSESLLKRIHAPHYVMQAVKPLVAEHMTHINPLSPKAVRRLALRLEPNNIETLALLIEADASGRPPLPKGLPEGALRLLKLAKDLEINLESPKPILLGRHLLDLAQAQVLPAKFLRGGPHFSELLNRVFQAQLDGEISTLEEAKQLAVSMIEN